MAIRKAVIPVKYPENISVLSWDFNASRAELTKPVSTIKTSKIK